MSAPTGTDAAGSPGREPGELTPTEENLLVSELPPHQHRRADSDPRAAQRAERQVATMFGLSALSTIAFVVCYATIEPDADLWLPVIGDTSAMNFSLGLTLGLALFLIGAGAIHWAKKLMSDEEIVAQRHVLGSDEATTAAAAEDFALGTEESGFVKRPIIRRTLLAAMALVPIPAVVILRDLGPLPGERLRSTIWAPGVRLVTDVTRLPIRAEDIPLGGVVMALPENLLEVEEADHNLNARAKAPLILVRMQPDEIRAQQGDNWDVGGVLAYSRICTHVGCPVGLYEQRTHHLLCPCHQSTFDISDAGAVVFGPAARRLPQLAITVDDEGYLVAQRDFDEPVGPSFWERG
jgi:ubiquinol-cytochrome c reductase iron-sulfur subunit